MSGRHVPALDGIRGLAVVGVVAHHLGALRGGYLGVDAFFVLSGFLITGLLIDEADRSSGDGHGGWNGTGAPIALGAFWTRRAKRLLPALGVLLATVVIVERWIIDGGQRAVDLRDETIAAAAYVFNWQQIHVGVDYWSSFDALSPLRHMWSLAIEEQFYVIWPLVVLATLIVGRGRRWPRTTSVGLVAGLGALASVVLGQIIFDPLDSLRNYYGTDVRVAAILFGAVGAMAVRRLDDLVPATRHRLAMAGCVVTVPIAAAWIALDGQSTLLYRGGLVATGLATAFVVVAAVLAPESALARVLSLRLLRWFGSISYGLYLWHWPFIVWLTPGRIGFGGAGLLALRLASALAATLLSYHLIEQPIRRARWTGAFTFRWSAAAIGALVVLAAAGVSPGDDPRIEAGSRDTTPIPTLGTTTTTTTTTTATTTTTTTVAPSGPADTSDASTASTSMTTTTSSTIPMPLLERLLVVGDSGAFFLGEPLVAAADGVVVVQRGQVGCGLVTDGGGVRTGDGGFLADAEDCAAFPTRLQNDVDAFQPTHVLFVYSWPGIGDREIDGTFVDPCSPIFAATFEQRLGEVIAIAGSTGARVVVADTPYFVAPTGELAAVETTDCLNVSVRRVVDAVDVIDLAEWVCPEGQCRLNVDGEPLRPDGLHFEGRGGEVAAEWIVSELT